MGVSGRIGESSRLGWNSSGGGRCSRMPQSIASFPSAVAGISEYRAQMRVIRWRTGRMQHLADAKHGDASTKSFGARAQAR